MRAQVIKFSSDAFPGATHLDFNNGYVYDAAGNQLAKMSVKDDTRDETIHKMCADWMHGESLTLMGNAYRGGFDARKGSGGSDLAHETDRIRRETPDPYQQRQARRSALFHRC